MTFALLVFLLTAQGPNTFAAGPFDSKDECEVKQAQLPEKIGNANFNAEPGDRIAYFTSACLEIKPAPQGKQI